LADPGLQVLALQELHHDVVLAHVEDADDVGVVEDAGRLGLAAETLGELLCGDVAEVLRLDGLDRDMAGDQRSKAL